MLRRSNNTASCTWTRSWWRCQCQRKLVFNLEAWSCLTWWWNAQSRISDDQYQAHNVSYRQESTTWFFWCSPNSAPSGFNSLSFWLPFQNSSSDSDLCLKWFLFSSALSREPSTWISPFGKESKAMMNLVFIAKQEEQPEGCPECVDFFSLLISKNTFLFYKYSNLSLHLERSTLLVRS